MINRRAKAALYLPHSSRSGTRKNSSAFIEAIMMICVIAFNLDFTPVNIQIAITVSEIPIKIVKGVEYLFPKICATIWWCLGTKLKTLQKSPFASQIAAMQYVRIL